MPNVLFTRTNNPNAKSIVDGQVIFSTEGSGAIYLDNGTERLKMGENENKVDKSNVLHTLDECVNSENDNDVVGATVMKEVNRDFLSDIRDRLEVDGTPFVFDYQDGQFGYNTDPNRGADTFFPFKKGGSVSAVDVVYVDGKSGGGGASATMVTCQYKLTQAHKDYYDVLIYSWCPNTGSAEHNQQDDFNGTTLVTGKSSDTYAKFPATFKYVFTKDVEVGAVLKVSDAWNYVGVLVIGIKIGDD